MTRTPWTLATEKVLDIVAVTSFNRADLASSNPCYRPRFQLSASVNVVMVASMVRLLSIRVAPYWRCVALYAFLAEKERSPGATLRPLRFTPHRRGLQPRAAALLRHRRQAITGQDVFAWGLRHRPLRASHRRR